jgi:hypothetical protein
MVTKQKSSKSSKRYFGKGKYAALNLILAKWLRHYAKPRQKYSYITLGGTELYDVKNIAWIDGTLVSTVRAYEQKSERHAIALKAVATIRDHNINIELLEKDMFQYKRDIDGKHIYFFDFEGTCAGEHHQRKFEKWFEDQIIKADDLLIITSYLGRNIGWDQVLDPFEGIFRKFRIESVEDRKLLYVTAHPGFLLHDALRKSGMDSEIRLNNFAFVKYFDSSPMGLYAFSCETGVTNLRNMVEQISTFDTISRTWKEHLKL